MTSHSEEVRQAREQRQAFLEANAELSREREELKKQIEFYTKHVANLSETLQQKTLLLNQNTETYMQLGEYIEQLTGQHPVQIVNINRTAEK